MIQKKCADLPLIYFRLLDRSEAQSEIFEGRDETCQRLDHGHQAEIGGSQQPGERHERDGVQSETAGLRGHGERTAPDRSAPEVAVQMSGGEQPVFAVERRAGCGWIFLIAGLHRAVESPKADAGRESGQIIP